LEIAGSICAAAGDGEGSRSRRRDFTRKGGLKHLELDNRKLASSVDRIHPVLGSNLMLASSLTAKFWLTLRCDHNAVTGDRSEISNLSHPDPPP